MWPQAREGTAKGGSKGSSEGLPKGSSEGLPKRSSQGLPKGSSEGVSEGSTKGMAERHHQGATKGSPQGSPQGLAQGVSKGSTQGDRQGVSQGPAQGSAEGSSLRPAQGTVRSAQRPIRSAKGSVRSAEGIRSAEVRPTGPAWRILRWRWNAVRPRYPVGWMGVVRLPCRTDARRCARSCVPAAIVTLRTPLRRRLAGRRWHGGLERSRRHVPTTHLRRRVGVISELGATMRYPT